MSAIRCFMMGYHDCPDHYFNYLMSPLMTLTGLHNVTEFYVGRRGNFDRLAAQAVQLLKRNHPEIRLILLEPYPRRDFVLPEGFDSVCIPPDARSDRYAIVRMNRHMADTVEYMLTCADGRGTNTDRLLQYVRPRVFSGDLQVYNILRLVHRFESKLTDSPDDGIIEPL